MMPSEQRIDAQSFSKATRSKTRRQCRVLTAEVTVALQRSEQMREEIVLLKEELTTSEQRRRDIELKCRNWARVADSFSGQLRHADIQIEMLERRLIEAAQTEV